MESVFEGLLTNPATITAIIIGASALLLVYILKLFRQEAVVEQKPKHEKSAARSDKKKDTAHSGKNKKKVAENRWAARSEKQAYTHPWLLTSLKGHNGAILDMDFSSNGKYLTSCGDEDPDPGGLTTESSSSSECNKENTRPPSSEPNARTKGLSRRQRKNRRREDASPADGQKSKKQKAKKTVDSASPANLSKKQAMAVVPLRQFVKFSATETTFAHLLHNYLLTHDQMLLMGYPIQSAGNNDVIVYKGLRMHPTRFDVNAREFIPKKDSYLHDSGQGSGSSSDSGELDSEESSSSSSSSSSSEQEAQAYYLHNQVCLPPLCKEFFQRTCSRCGRLFYTTSAEYITKERCCYHWGKLQTLNRPGDKRHGQLAYSCCNTKSGSRGCSEGRLHVWNGVRSGPLGPQEEYVYTKPRRTPPPDGNNGVYALDCEMCYTVRGLELTKVTVVAMDGRLVYDSFVKPDFEIVDYNTRFSGITCKDMKRFGAKNLREVQNDLMGFVSANTILIGHGLENDLKALKMVHYLVVDTAYSFPHFNGLPYRRSLRNLASTVLKREIQCGGNGHNSYEDASACMELMLWRVRRDFRHFLMQH